jgi:uncharacterized ubiquitin-like protein YukD
MLNSVILTVRTGIPRHEYDMEFPANIPGGQLCGELLAALRSIENEKYRASERIRLRIERTGEMLGGDQTLEDAEVWDGGIVTVIQDAQA